MAVSERCTGGELSTWLARVLIPVGSACGGPRGSSATRGDLWVADGCRDLLSGDVLGEVIRGPDHPLVPASLVVCDTLSRCFGDIDENSARDVNKVVGALDRLVRRGTTVVLIHHAGRNRRLRGSTALEAAADMVISLKARERNIVLTCEKARDGAPFADPELRLIKAGVGGNTSCVVSAPSRPAKSPPLSPKADLALRLLREKYPAGATYTEWQKASDQPESTFRRLLRELGNHVSPPLRGKTKLYTPRVDAAAADDRHDTAKLEHGGEREIPPQHAPLVEGADGGPAVQRGPRGRWRVRPRIIRRLRATMMRDRSRTSCIDLGALMADPDLVMDVEPEAMPSLLAEVATREARLSTVRTLLGSRLAAASAIATPAFSRLLKADEVAKVLEVPKAYVYELMRKNLLGAVNIGKYRRVASADLESFIRHNRLDAQPHRRRV